MRPTVSLVLAGCLVLTLAGPARAGHDRSFRGFERITFGSDCTGTAGHLRVRAERARGDRTRITMVASDLADPARSGARSMTRDDTVVVRRFRVRAHDGRARHTATLDVPFGRNPVAAAVRDRGGDVWCRTGVTYAPESIEVRGADRTLKVQLGSDLFVWYTDTACDAGTAWRGRMVATWPDLTVRRPLLRDDCGDQVIGMLVDLRQETMPRSVALLARDDTGDVWRASYALG